MGPLRFIALLACFYAALLADTAWGPRLALGRASPDWTALVLVVWLLRTRWERAPLAAGGLGLLVDLAVGGRVGPGIAAFALAGYVIPRVAARLIARFVLVEAFVVGVATAGIGIFLVSVAFVANELPDAPGRALLLALTTGAYTGVVAAPVLMLRNWIAGAARRPKWAT